MIRPNPYLAAAILMVLFWILYRVLSGNWNPFKMVIGADGRASSSKLQLWLWTVVILFSYVALYVARMNAGTFEVISDIPENILIVLGLSVITASAAKGITVSAIGAGKYAPTAASESSPGQAVSSSDGAPDLSKIQMLAWTLIAIGAYLIQVIRQIKHGAITQLPDIDSALMVLMGMGQGAYLGKKLVTTNVPRLSGLTPSSGNVGAAVSILGSGFGAAQDGSTVTFDRKPTNATIASWSDAKIDLVLPAAHPDGSALAMGRIIQIGSVVGGQTSANELPFSLS